MVRPPVQYPDPIGDALRERFNPSEDLGFDFAMTDDVIRWWDQRLGHLNLYPRALAARLAEGLPESGRTYRITGADPIKERVSVEIRVVDREGGTLIFSGRSVEFDNARIHLSKTTIRDDFQGLRHGRRLLRNAFALATDLNLARLTLTALMHGPWVWPRAGFLPDATDWATGRTKTKIVQQLYLLPSREIGENRREALRGFVERADRTLVRTLALLNDEVWSSKTAGMRVKLGWYLLVEGEATWKGSLQLDDQEAVKRLKRYLADGGVPL